MVVESRIWCLCVVCCVWAIVVPADSVFGWLGISALVGCLGSCKIGVFGKCWFVDVGFALRGLELVFLTAKKSAFGFSI